MKNSKLILAIILPFLFTSYAFALEQIIRPYQSLRSAAMGGVRYTTGLYDENFFGNPARAAANPKFRFQLPDPMVESTFSTFGAVSDLLDGDDFLTNISEESGKNLHGRIQLTFPSVYFASGKNNFGIGLITSAQFDVDLRRSFNVEPDAILDIGPAVTFARKFMKDDRLAVGTTAHITYRLAANEDFGLIDLLQGQSLSPSSSGGEGAHIDFDIGATYRVPWKPLGFDVTPGIAINNILGGKYSNLGLSPAGLGQLPRRQPRTYNLGVSFAKSELWKFSDFVFAFEITDIGNNPSGSLFRTIHFGSEARFGVLKPRLGFNQGYIAIGLGLDLKFVEIDLATYGEEMSLNAGGLQDRRIGARFAFKI